MRIGIDIGGTFTDFVLFNDTTGTFQTHKILSTPHDPAEAVLAQVANRQLLLGKVEEAPTATRPAKISIVHGSTVATNTLLERKGAITALITTEGFRDLLEIGRQNRPDIYDLFSRRLPALVPPELRFEVPERVDHCGHPIQPLDLTAFETLIGQLTAARVSSVAVSLLFSFLYPEHENTIAARLRQAGFFVSASNEVLPEFREYERTSTTVVNAYVSPVMDRYLARLERESGVSDFRVMQSNGGSIGLAQARREAVRCVLSGPAGGVVGARYVAAAAGSEQLLTFDMGGTSTDVSLCTGDIQITTESEIGGMPIRVPVIDINTVGSGGGSIAYVDAGGALRVGPQSAGADPGPVCYGRGGQQPTVTDANLILGRLPADHFLGGHMALNVAAAEATLLELAQAAKLSPRPGLTLAQTAALGVIDVVNAHMERALRVISVQRGHDPRDFTLVSFGGAGGLHAATLARGLNIPRLLIPPNAATLSAFGMLAADVVKDYVRTVMRPGDTAFDEVEALLAPLVAQGQADIMAEGISPANIVIERRLDMRYQGQSYELMTPLTPDFVGDFHAAHAYAYGYSDSSMPVEIVNVRVRATGHLSPPPLTPFALGPSDPTPALLERRPVVLAGDVAEIPFFDGQRLQPGCQFSGPAVIIHPDTTIFIEAGDEAVMDEHKNLIINVFPQYPENGYHPTGDRA
ncbi:MAG: hydantoinase/oxoprolinase family protein [Anaerolineae bacterium]|nr:hydantoinase/oxoprolinase family protein [Anaerolineae bacterium]